MTFAAKSTLLEIGYPSLIHYRLTPPHRLPNGQPGCEGLYWFAICHVRLLVDIQFRFATEYSAL